MGSTKLVGQDASSSAPVVRSAVVAVSTAFLHRSDTFLRELEFSAAVLTSATCAEAARILLTASSHSGVQADDRIRLVRIVTLQTGLAGPDIEAQQ